MGTCHERGSVRQEWRVRDDGLEESVQFVPGYNCSDKSMRGHGVHGMEVRWYLRGPKGGAQFVIYSGWIPGKLQPGHGLSPAGDYSWECYLHNGELRYPAGADVGYHAKFPQWEGQEPIQDDCAITGGPCYYDGSGLRAEKLARRFAHEGEQVIWDELEDVYGDITIRKSEAV